MRQPLSVRRRDLLGGALALTLAGRARAGSKSASLAGIEPKNVVDAYRARGLAALGDHQLVAAAAAVVSAPEDEVSSFTLHAPLELLARAGLLPLVAPADRELARMQVVASAVAYQEEVKHPVATPAARPTLRDLAATERDMRAAVEKGDPDGLEALVLEVARRAGSTAVVRLLTPLLLPTFTSASHGHIGLWLLLRHGSPDDASLLRGAVRQLARDPGARMTSFSGMDVRSAGPRPATLDLEREILDRLREPPRMESRGGIRSVMEAGERTGTIDRLFGALIRTDLRDDDIDAGFRAIAQVSAHVMIQGVEGDAHRLTQPQAAFGLASVHLERKLALASALVWITSYRMLGYKRALDFTFRPRPAPAGMTPREALESGREVAAGRFFHAAPGERAALREALATEAAIRPRQHMVKYTRACLDMAALDPGHEHLYLAAAAHNVGRGIERSPRSALLGSLSGRRDG